jgi:hypothetical protein
MHLPVSLGLFSELPFSYSEQPRAEPGTTVARNGTWGLPAPLISKKKDYFFPCRHDPALRESPRLSRDPRAWDPTPSLSFFPRCAAPIDGQMGHTTRHGTNTTQHDTIVHDTAGHDLAFVSCRANTPCWLLGPYTTRDLLSRVVPARRHGQHG